MALVTISQITNKTLHVIVETVNTNCNNNSDPEIDSETDTEPVSDRISIDSDSETNLIEISQPIECKCQPNNLEHVEINFFNKTQVVCLSNKDERCVINLTPTPLSPSQRQVLLKGLKFCPTPGEPSLLEIKKDLKAFFRRLKLRAHYYEEKCEAQERAEASQPTLDSFLSDSQGNNPESLGKFKTNTKTT